MVLPHERVSKVVAHALRHEPWLYELELDEQGWVQVEELLSALHAKGPVWEYLAPSDLEAMIAASSKRRYELDGGRIRALYGHSVPGRLAREEAPPPDLLFHGTSPQAWERIRHEGLVPMGRQYVHLSVVVDMALQVGRRKARRPMILLVRAADAGAAGVRFYRGNDQVWLADRVPPTYLIPAAEER